MTSLLLGLYYSYVLCESNVLPAVVELAVALVDVRSVGGRDLQVDAVRRDEVSVSRSVCKVVDVGVVPGNPRSIARRSAEVAIALVGVVGEDSRLAELGLRSCEVPR